MRCKYSKFSNCANQNEIFFLFSNQVIAILQDLKICNQEVVLLNDRFLKLLMRTVFFR